MLPSNGGDLFLASLARGSWSTLSVGMGCGMLDWNSLTTWWLNTVICKRM